MTRGTSTDLTWYYGQGQSPNYPATGPAGDKNDNAAQGYIYVDSSANEV